MIISEWHLRNFALGAYTIFPRCIVWQRIGCPRSSLPCLSSEFKQKEFYQNIFAKSHEKDWIFATYLHRKQQYVKNIGIFNSLFAAICVILFYVQILSQLFNNNKTMILRSRECFNIKSLACASLYDVYTDR